MIKKIIYLFSILLICSNVFASHKIDLKNNSVYINGEKTLEFRNSAFGQTPQDRASILVFNLINLNNSNLLNSNNVTVSDKTATVPYCIISVNNVPLINVTEEDAKSLNSTSIGLAKLWANNLIQALKKIPIYLLEKEVNIPMGETRSRVLYGYKLNNISINIENPTICSIDYNNIDNSFIITGINLGETNVTFSNGEDFVKLKVYVKKYAADLPDELNLKVTGNPISANETETFLKRNILNYIKTEPLASSVINSVKTEKKALYPNNKTTAKVNITCYGDNYISITKTINYLIENVNMETGTPAKLHYSNNPETIEHFGDVYIGKLDIDKCNRLLYHHMNKTGEKAKLVMEIINSSDEDINLRVRRSAAKPIVDTIAIGVVAGKEFMQACYKNLSYIDYIPANSRVCYLCDSLPNKYSSSGIFEFTQLNGTDNLSVRIRLTKENNCDINLYETRPYLGTGKFVYSDFVFDNPQKEYNETYTVGGKYVFMPFGKFHLENEKHLKLYGNYGVSYTYNIKCENPTEKSQKCRVYIDPSAGSLAAFLKINNEYITVHHVKPPNEYNLLTFILEPGETKNIKIETIPLSGSSYPAKIVVGNAN